MDSLKIILEKYENGFISNKVIHKKILSKSLREVEYSNITEFIHSELEMKRSNKKYINFLKIMLIHINKNNSVVNDKKQIEEDILKLMNTYSFDLDNDVSIEENSHLIKKIYDSYKDYFQIDKKLFNTILEDYFKTNEIYNEYKKQYYHLWKKINKMNESQNNMSKIIHAFNKNHNILFLSDKTLLENKENILKFVSNLGYTYLKKDKMNNLKLKRGFIKIVEKDNEEYLLKYQPNNSFIEIIMNINTIQYENASKYICFPETIIMNSNNSYFYIIKKYECDLFKFFNKKIILYEKNIQKIFLFLAKSIHFLHKNNIIYGDIKLENIIVNTKDNKISDLKLIDFDVSLFNNIPECIELFDDKIKKIFSNKKVRGTKIYMKKTETMSFKNDIYSIGVFMIILLYKNILLILNEERLDIEENIHDKIKKKLYKYKAKIENDATKVELLDYIIRIYKNRRFSKYWNNELYSINKIRILIQKCLKMEFTTNILLDEIKESNKL